MDQPSNPLDLKAFLPHHIPSPTTIPIPTTTSTSTSKPKHKDIFHKTLLASPDMLFLIRYTHTGTLTAKWYLVQVDLESTKITNPNFLIDHKYWCIFQAKHTGDNKKSDECSRWWPEWWRYHHDSETRVLVYDYRVEVRPDRIMSARTHVQWATLLTLHGDDNCVLLGPFNFELCDGMNRIRRKLPTSTIETLHSTCIEQSLLPPTLRSQSMSKPLPTSSRKRRRAKKAHPSKT